MNKKATLAFLLATSAFFIMGCSNNSENNSTKTSNDLTYSKPSYNTLKRPFVLSNSTFTKCPFVIKDNSIIFPNTNDENRISYIDSTFNNNIINTSDVKDFINLSTDDLCISNNTIYFSNISKGNRLSSTNFNSKTEEIISEDNVSNLVAVDNLIYYINNTDSKHLYVYDTNTKKTTLISDNTFNNFIINGDFILFQNPNDQFKLYKVRIDGSETEKITDFSVDSYVIHENVILAINSSDNNNLYSIDPSNLKATRLFLMNGENLKAFNGKLYFINCDDSNYLYTLNVNLADSTCTSNALIKDSISDYYLNEKGIFVNKNITPNNISYKSYN
ncbi:DUF5050 domain-containing protein [Clostridium sp. HCP1S3_B4]|uniref:DUF5050 domain-containing protein n=1 Tax=unclassified Clostridium TaxID=2614128 RepID=UPI0016AD05D3|nr:DUF5050 domain-containing protein [Clostridiales bacterium]